MGDKSTCFVILNDIDTVCETQHSYLQEITIDDLLLFPVSDTLDDMLEESGDESEEDAIVNQVLDEIGIEITGKVGNGLFFLQQYCITYADQDV